MNETEFAVGWRMLTANPWPRLPEKIGEVRGLYFAMAQDLSPDQWGAAVRDALRRCVHFPGTAELFGDANGLGVDCAAQRAWESVLEGVRSGSYTDGLGERTTAALRGIGGIRRVCECRQTDLGFIRREFAAAWAAHRDAERRGELTPAMRATRDALNPGRPRLQLLPPGADVLTDEERDGKARFGRGVGGLLRLLGARPESAERAAARERSIARADGVRE